MKVCIVGAGAIDGLVRVVREIGTHFGIATPNIDALFGVARLLAQTKGLYGAPV